MNKFKNGLYHHGTRNDLMYPPTQFKVYDDPKVTRVPKIGDKCKITDYAGMNPNEAIEIDKLPYLTIDDVLPLPIGPDSEGTYYWRYQIYVKETGFLIGLDGFKLL